MGVLVPNELAVILYKCIFHFCSTYYMQAILPVNNFILECSLNKM